MLFRKRSDFCFTRRAPENLKGHYRRDMITYEVSPSIPSTSSGEGKSTGSEGQTQQADVNRRLSRFHRDRTMTLLEPTGDPLLSEAATLTCK